MIFSSPIFLFCFLPIFLAGLFLLPGRWKQIFVLLCSLIFYAWTGPRFLVILLVFAFVNYACGLVIGWSIGRGKKTERFCFITGIGLHLGTLLVFKYLIFFADSWNGLLGTGFHIPQIALPLGISFYSFSGIAYLIDIYLGKIQAEKNILRYGYYFLFFPKLIQGPITRYRDFSVQVENAKPDIANLSTGCMRFVVGLSKKVILADPLGVMVNQVFSIQPIHLAPSVAWLGAIGYTLQIYLDFSGYTDMAIGLAKMIGITLPENFNSPYLATSITDFWRRWHITLSSWFRDYLFLPLEMKYRNRKLLRQEINTMIVFLLTGLWHGAAWNFILWGGLHGLVICVERLVFPKKMWSRWIAVLRWTGTMLILICGWVLFRAPDIRHAGGYLLAMTGMAHTIPQNLSLFWYLTPKIGTILVAAILVCVPWEKIPAIQKWMQGERPGQLVLKDIGFILMIALALVMVMSSSIHSFIYFNF